MPPELGEERNLHKLMRGYAPRKTNLSAYVEFFQNEVIGPLKIGFPDDFPVRLLNLDFRTPTDRGRLFVRELTHSTANKALFRLPLDHHGTGLISVLAMVTTIAVLKEHHRQALNGKPFIITIEEPEVHLHPHAQRTFMEFLRLESDNNQILVATHSPIFVDRAQPENVVVMRRAKLKDAKQSKGKVRAGNSIVIYHDYQKNWGSVISSLGLKLSDVLMGGDVNLIVEGPTEAILLPAMAERLSLDSVLDLNFERVFLVPGGGGNIPHLAKILSANGNPTIVVVDNDKGGREIIKNLPEIDKIITLPKIKNLPAPFNHLKKHEFEDLLDSKALLEVFNEALFKQPGFNFLPLKHSEFESTRTKLIGQSKNFGWIDTINTLIESKVPSENSIKPSKEKFSKRILAEKAADHIRVGKLNVPDFCKRLLLTISEYL